MKTKSSIQQILLASAIIASAISAPGLACAEDQNTGGNRGSSSSQQSVSSSIQSGLNVTTENGRSVITLNGKEIYTGPINGTVSTKTSNINGVEATAVYDGDKLLWESAPGAAQQAASASGGATGIDRQKFMEEHQKNWERLLKEQREFMQAHGAGNLPTLSSNGGFSQSSTKTASGGSSSTHTSGGGSTQTSQSGQSTGANAGEIDRQKFMEEHQKNWERLLKEQREFMQAHGAGNLPTLSSNGGFSQSSTKKASGGSSSTHTSSSSSSHTSGSGGGQSGGNSGQSGTTNP